jgi:hypothetical protein
MQAPVLVVVQACWAGGENNARVHRVTVGRAANLPMSARAPFLGDNRGDGVESRVTVDGVLAVDVSAVDTTALMATPGLDVSPSVALANVEISGEAGAATARHVDELGVEGAGLKNGVLEGGNASSIDFSVGLFEPGIALGRFQGAEGGACFGGRVLDVEDRGLAATKGDLNEIGALVDSGASGL